MASHKPRPTYKYTIQIGNTVIKKITSQKLAHEVARSVVRDIQVPGNTLNETSVMFYSPSKDTWVLVTWEATNG